MNVDVRQPTEKKEYLNHLDRSLRESKTILANALDESCDFGLHILRSHLLDDGLEIIEMFATISISDSSQLEQYEEKIKHAIRRPLQRGLS